MTALFELFEFKIGADGVVVAGVVGVYGIYYCKFLCLKLVAMENKIATTVFFVSAADVVVGFCVYVVISVYFGGLLGIKISRVGVHPVSHV